MEETVVIEGLSEFEAKLKKLQTDNPGFEQRLRGAIRKVMGDARAKLRDNAASGLRMQSDPRHAYKAVRYAVYKKVFGGQVNILNSRKAGGETPYKPPRTLTPGQRGGNRRKRNSRDLDKYEGADRGFILRWLNDGTDTRTIKDFKTDDRRANGQWPSVPKRNQNPNTGNRGAIAPRNWFKGASLRELQNAAQTLQEIIDKVIKEEFV